MTVSGRSLALVGLLVIGGALAYVAWPREALTPEEEVRRLTSSLVEAASKKDLATIMSHVSERFQTEAGLDRQQLKALLAAELFRGRWVRVLQSQLDVRRAEGDVIETRGDYVLARVDSAAVSTYVIEARFLREPDGVWRAISARYERSGAGL